MTPRIDLKGKKFHRLLVLDSVSKDRAGRSRWSCVCDCGNRVVVSGDHLTRNVKPVKSCGCIKPSGANHPQWTGVGEISGGWWAAHVQRELFGKSRRTDLAVDLTKEQAWGLFLEQDRRCALTGLPLVIGNNAQANASLDRIDSSVGYTLSNMQWVHKDINFMKRIYSQNYFIEMCRLVAQRHPNNL